MHDERDRTDALLDSLLSNYSAVEPRTGLETRIRANLKAHSTRQRRYRLLAPAVGTAAVVVLVAFMSTRTTQSGNTNHTSVSKLPNTAMENPARTSHPPHNAFRQQDAGRKTMHKRNNNRIVLQFASTVHGDDGLIFQQEKLYLSTVTRNEPEPPAQPAASAPAISIQELGVQPVEVKDLAAGVEKAAGR